MEDREVVRRVQAGDREAFALLVEKYHRPLLNFIYHLRGEASSVEDIGQEVFLSAYRSLGRFDPGRGTPFAAWLFIIARNRVFSELRRKRPRASVEEFLHLRSREAGPEEALLSQERVLAVRECLEVLPETYRKTLVDHLEGRSGADRARVGGVPAGTVKARLFRAKRMLRVLLEKRFGGLGHG